MTDQPLPPGILAGAGYPLPTVARDYTTADDVLPLPGLEDAPEHESALVGAVRRTLQALAAENLLTEIHAARCQLLLELAGGYARSTAGGKVTVAASAVAGQIQALLDSLPAPAVGGEHEDAWSRLVAEFERERGRAASGNAPHAGAAD